MRNLLDFILKNSHSFLFFLLEVLCLVLLFRFNNYQGSVYFTSANRFCGLIYEATSQVTGYFHLRAVNDSLTERNIKVEQELVALRREVMELSGNTVNFDSLTTAALQGFNLIKAHVVNNSLNHMDNYLTIDRGSADGLASEMGVVNGMGVVGIVDKTASHHALVISLLNSKSNVSCKIKGRDYFGYLRWDGKDSRFSWLRDLPRHAVCHKGDTIVTSGYSAIFPEGIMVGTVDKVLDSNDGLSYLVKIKLAVDFGRLDDVRIIFRKGMDEQQKLEKEIQ